MEKEEILKLTEDGIIRLYKEIEGNPENYEYEIDAQIDLYFLLNYNNFDIFWKKKCIKAEDEVESGYEIDLVIYNPDIKKPQKEIAIELKYNSWNSPIKKKKSDGKRYKEIEYDFYKLFKLKDKVKDIIPIFIYIKNRADELYGKTTLLMPFEEIMKDIKLYKKLYNDIRVYILDIDKKEYLSEDEFRKILN